MQDVIRRMSEAAQVAHANVQGAKMAAAVVAGGGTVAIHGVDEYSAVVRAALAAASEAGYVLVERALLSECADDLTSWVDQHYKIVNGEVHQAMQRKYELDIELPNKLRAILERAPKP